MILFSLAKPTLKFTTLRQVTDAALFAKYLKLVTNWFTDEWGYLHDKDKPREEVIKERGLRFAENADKIYLAFYGDLVVGAFRVEEKEFPKEPISRQIRREGRPLKVSEIWFIYVDPICRNLGVGRQILQKIKQLSEEMGVNMILLETLKPSLNQLYKTEGAKVVCENYLNSYPTDVLNIRL